MVTLLTLFGLILLAGGPVGAHFYLFSPLLGIGVAGVGLALLSLLFFVSLVQFLRGGGGETSWLAFFFGFFALAGLGALGYFAFQNPLHDITTDVKKPPAFLHPAYPFRVEKGAEYLDPSLRLTREYVLANAATQLQLYPNLETTLTPAPPAEVYAAAVKTVHDQLVLWKNVLDDPQARHAEWEVEDPYVHAIVDVALEVRGDAQHPYDSYLVIRSRSRIDAPDLGLDVLLLRDLKVRLNLAMEPIIQQFQGKRAEFESGPGALPKPVETPAQPKGTAPAPRPVAPQPQPPALPLKPAAPAAKPAAPAPKAPAPAPKAPAAGSEKKK